MGIGLRHRIPNTQNMAGRCKKRLRNLEYPVKISSKTRNMPHLWTKESFRVNAKLFFCSTEYAEAGYEITRKCSLYVHSHSF